MGAKNTMRTAVLRRPGHFEVADTRLPEPQASQVRVRIEGCGVCGSNLPPWEGRGWFEYPFSPGAPGHEAWGEVDALGEGVSRCTVGERIAFLGYRSFAEFDVAEESHVVRLPHVLKKKPFPGEAVGCAMNVAARCDFRPGQTVAIVGIGFLGALLTALAVRAGTQVIAISRREFALDVAKALGASQTIRLGTAKEIVHKVKTITAGELCDRVIEAAGVADALTLAGELTTERGRMIIAGYHQDGPRQVNMQLWNWRGIDVINAHERDPSVYIRGMEAAVLAIARGDFDPTPLYTHTFPLLGIADAFHALHSRPDNFLKALIQL